MTELPIEQKITSKYIMVFIVAVVLSWIAHEFAHWLAGEYLGYDMAMRLNSSYPVNGSFTAVRDYTIVSAAGPLFTLLEAVVIYVLMKKDRRILLYPFLFTCFYMRLLAAGISVINPNDEARISRDMGWGTFTLPLIIIAILFSLVFTISRLYKLNTKFVLANVGLAMLFTSIIVMADQFLKIRLI